jgi:DNA-binding NarL/FixJ family response regulator
MPIRVLIADDHGVLRAGLRTLIAAQPDMEVVGEAADGDEAVRRAAELDPDVIVLDVEMPRTGGLTALHRLRSTCPRARVLILTMHDEPTLVRSALEAGASGFVVKEALGDDLLAAVRTVYQGRGYINMSLAAREGAAAPSPQASALPEPGRTMSRLSQREHQVLEMLAQGFTNQEIGARLHLSPRTIGTYRSRLNDKLGLRTRADIVRYALESGLLARE